MSQLPGKLEVPAGPPLGRWALFGVPMLLAAGGLVAMLWPRGEGFLSGWYWFCVLGLPCLSAAVLGAVCLISRERERDFVDSWNRQHDAQLAALVMKGQRSLALLAASYQVPGDSQHLAQAMKDGIRPLQPGYLPTQSASAYLGQLDPVPADGTELEYCRRLQGHLKPVLERLRPDIQRLRGTAPVAVRIKHDGALSSPDLLGAWHAAAGAEEGFASPELSVAADGLLWLDTWLDEAGPGPLRLSVEINLFMQPRAGQAESVSALLLGTAEWAISSRLEPLAWICRPVPLSGPATGVADALLWGQVPLGDPSPFTWHSQVNGTFLRELTLAMAATANPAPPLGYLDLDECFGQPGAAVANIAIIVASEQAQATAEPQLVLLHDSSVQACVVRPV